MNTITKVIANAWVKGDTLNAVMRDAETRYALPTTPRNLRRWIYGFDGRQLSPFDLFGPIVIEVEADTK